ncbi:hypothetical protein [Vibrio phage vB_pir03]|nr:hypothetical protein [Vibrio phage vB_pir03]
MYEKITFGAIALVCIVYTMKQLWQYFYPKKKKVVFPSDDPKRCNFASVQKNEIHPDIMSLHRMAKEETDGEDLVLVNHDLVNEFSRFMIHGVIDDWASSFHGRTPEGLCRVFFMHDGIWFCVHVHPLNSTETIMEEMDYITKGFEPKNEATVFVHQYDLTVPGHKEGLIVDIITAKEYVAVIKMDTVKGKPFHKCSGRIAARDMIDLVIKLDRKLERMETEHE